MPGPATALDDLISVLLLSWTLLTSEKIGGGPCGDDEISMGINTREN